MSALEVEMITPLIGISMENLHSNKVKLDEMIEGGQGWYK
jgi:hypothetical protein